MTLTSAQYVPVATSMGGATPKLRVVSRPGFEWAEDLRLATDLARREVPQRHAQCAAVAGCDRQVAADELDLELAPGIVPRAGVARGTGLQSDAGRLQSALDGPSE